MDPVVLDTHRYLSTSEKGMNMRNESGATEQKAKTANPFPRLYVEDTRDSRGYVLKGEGQVRMVAVFMGAAEETKPLADYAAKAINCHEDLVTALGVAIEALEAERRGHGISLVYGGEGAINLGYQVLAKVGV